VLIFVTDAVCTDSA